MMTADIIRILLVADIVVMAILALVFLRQRRMKYWFSYFGWSLVAVFIPILGPFFVIITRPGTWDPDFSIQSDINRLVDFFRRFLPEPPQPSVRLRRSRLRKILKQR